MTAVDTATDVVADVAEGVADQAQQLADVSRTAGGRGIGLALGALLLGTGIGGGLGYLLAARKLETKFSQIADDEIAEMRETYMAKVRAAEAAAAKGSLKDLVDAKGYATASDEIPSKPERASDQPPMAVQPPESMIDSEDEAAGEPPDDSAMAETEVEGAEGIRNRGEAAVVNVFAEARRALPDWDWHAERASRSPDEPYVIHYDERYEMEGYSEVSLTYFEADDVLCGDHDEAIDPDRRHRIIGEKNLERFGHGSNDPDVVYVRNDDLQIVYEISRSDGAYVTEVHGLAHEAYDRGPVERMRARERYAQDE